MKNIFKPNNLKVLILLFFFGFILIYHFYGYMGHYGYDDIHYAKLAKQLSEGHLNLLTDQYAYRWTIVGLTAISYTLFGMNDNSSAIIPILITFITLLLVYKFSDKQKFGVLMLAIALYSLNNPIFLYSNKLMPDIYVALSIFASIFIIYHYKFNSDKNKTFLYAFLLSLSLFFGFISKGTIILFSPVLIYLIVIDIIKKREIKFWVFSATISLFLIIIYFSIIKILTGNIFQRFDAITINSYLNPYSYDFLPAKFLLERISYKLILNFIKANMFTAFIFIIPLFFSIKFKNLLKLSNPYYFLLGVFVVLFLSSNFMTISYTDYVPMSIDARHYLFLIPLASVIAAPVIYNYFNAKKYKNYILIISLIVTSIALLNNYKSAHLTYLPTFILIFIRYCLPTNISKLKNIFLLIFVAVLFIAPVNMIKYAKSTKYDVQKNLIKDKFYNINKKSVIITNDVQKRFAQYYLEFDTTQNAKFIKYDEISDYKFDKNCNIFLLKNFHTRFLSGMSNNDLPTFAKIIPNKFKKIFEDGFIQLYQINNISDLNVGKIIFNSFNDFEKKYKYWKINNKIIVHNTTHSGNNANYIKAKAYSASLILPYNLINSDTTKDMIINAKVWCDRIQNANAQLVISIEDKGKSIYWQGVEIKKYTRIVNEWRPAKIERKLPCNINPNSLIKIYVWNYSDNDMIIDDFEVSVMLIPRNGQ